MTNAMWLLALLAQDPELGLDARSRRAGTEWELTLAGTLRGAADGASVGLRFHRVTRRANWEDRSIETAPSDDGPGRAATLERGRFAHVERFDAPGEVEVRVLLDAGEVRRSVRVGTPGDVAGSVHAASKRIDDALRDLAALAELAGRGAEKRELRRSLDRAAESARKASDSPGLPAAAGALRSLAADVEAAVAAMLEDRPLCRWISNLSGQSFCLEDAPAFIEGIEELASRERGLALLGELEAARRAAVDAVFASDRKRWNRGLHAARQAIEALRRAADERLAGVVDGTEALLGLGESAMACEGGTDPEFRERHEALTAACEALERELRGRP